MATSSVVPCPQGRKYGCSTLVMVSGSSLALFPLKVPSRVQAKELWHGTATLVTGIPISITGKQRSGLAYKNERVYTAVSSFRDSFPTRAKISSSKSNQMAAWIHTSGTRTFEYAPKLYACVLFAHA